MNRIWTEAAGFPKYEVSNDGLMRNKSPRSDRPAILKGTPDKDGYIKHQLRAAGRSYNRTVHRIMWESFCAAIPEGMQINHKNGVKNDNRLVNLEVCTPSENTAHGFRVLGRKPVLNPQIGSKNGRAKLNEADIPDIREMLRAGQSEKHIALLYKVSPASIYFIRTGQTWKNVVETNT